LPSRLSLPSLIKILPTVIACRILYNNTGKNRHYIQARKVMSMKVKVRVKIGPKPRRLDPNQLASKIIQAVLELERKRQRGQFEYTEEEQKVIK